MTNKFTPEEMLEVLDRWKMTPEERALADAEKAGKEFGKILAGIIILFLAPTIVWLALVYLVGFQVAWVKVFGAYFIFNFIKNIIKNTL